MEDKTKDKIKVLNIIWGFSTGGIGKLFLTYASLGRYDTTLDVISVCIDLKNCEYDRTPLENAGIKVIPITSRKDISWIRAIGKLAKTIKPDVVFCHGFNGPIIVKVASLFERSLRVPMVCSYHGLYNPPTKSRRLFTTIINKTQAWIYKKYANTVILVAKYSGEYLLERKVPVEKLEVVYNGIPAEEPPCNEINLDNSKINIGMVGRLDAIKGINFLIEAIKEVIQRINDQFHVYIIGDGPEKDELIELTKRLGVDEYISFVGYQSNVSAWMKSWDIFCLPSLQENHSIALLEAMRAGSAIICTNVGGNPETVIDNEEALLVPSRDSHALANALVQVIQSQNLRDNLGKNARKKFIERFTEDVMKYNICKILKKVGNGA